MHLKKKKKTGLQFDCLHAFYWSMSYTIFTSITAAAAIANNRHTADKYYHLPR